MAQSEPIENAIDMMKQVIGNCVTGKKFNVENLPMFDIEYIFLKLRAKSVNNMLEFTVRDKVDDKDYNLKIDLDKIEVKRDPKHDPKITLDDNMGFVLRYPNLSTLDLIKESLNDNAGIETLFDIIASCIEKIFEGDKLFVHGVDFTVEEARDFLESLPSSAFEKVQVFFATIPQVEHTVHYKRVDGTDAEVTLKGLSDFFT